MDLSITSDHASDRISLYRTAHVFSAYAELRDVAQLPSLADWRERRGGRMVLVGNGSNLLLARRRIDSLVVRNALPRCLERRADGLVWASGSTGIMEVLRFCHRESLDSFYYLASVPATIGGAVAMNAGRGRDRGGSIFDFVRRITYYDLDAREVREIRAEEARPEYRRTVFSGATGKVVLEAGFEFPPTRLEDNPIETRKAYAASQQDYSGPNCGSVFAVNDERIMHKLRKRGLAIGGARFSKKTFNWIVNDSSRPLGLVALVAVAELWHRIARRPVRRELVTVR